MAQQLLPKASETFLSVDDVVTRLRNEFGFVAIDPDEADDMISNVIMKLVEMNVNPDVIAKSTANIGKSALVTVADYEDDERELDFFIYPDESIFLRNRRDDVSDLVVRVANCLGYVIDDA